jgi:hypothetical protein
VLDFLKKHKERVTLIGVGFAFLLFVGGGIYLQDKNMQGNQPVTDASTKTVKLKVSPQTEGQKNTKSPATTTAFFLRPSADELLAELAAMENLNKDVVNSKFSYLRVLWPAFFFTLEQDEAGQTTMLLDVSEDGFGVQIQSEVDVGAFPQLLELTTGEKMWLGGEILAVDPNGTGTIYIKTEHISFGDEPPLTLPEPKTEN